MVSWEFNPKEAPKLRVSNKEILLFPFESFDLLGSKWIDSLIASGFNIIIPKSGNIIPYEPEATVYPEFVLIPEPFDPETNWYALVDPIKGMVTISFELSVMCNNLCPPLPDNVRLKDPGMY